MQIAYKGEDIRIQQWISKLFNGTAFKTEDGKPIRFDLRTEVGLLDQALSQVPAVVANEVIVRCLYMLSRLKAELERCEVSKVSGLHKLKASHFMPYNSRVLTRMVTVSSTSFVLVNLATAAVRAGIECEGNKVVFAQKFFLRITTLELDALRLPSMPTGAIWRRKCPRLGLSAPGAARISSMDFTFIAR